MQETYDVETGRRRVAVFAEENRQALIQAMQKDLGVNEVVVNQQEITKAQFKGINRHQRRVAQSRARKGRK